MKTKLLLSATLAAVLGAASAFAQATPVPSKPDDSGKPANVGKPVDAGKPADAGKGSAAPHTPDEHASDVAKAVQKVISDFDAKRDEHLAERKALIDKLQAATTDAERKAILD